MEKMEKVKNSITVLITGIPAFVHDPETKPNESPLQFLIRYHPGEWKNFIEYLSKELKVSETICNRMKSKFFKMGEITDPIVSSKILEWCTQRLPYHGRTFKCLSDLRKSCAKLPPSPLGNITIDDILWPKENDPDGDNSSEKIATEMGVKVLPMKTGMNRELNMIDILPHIKSDFLWVVPGGSNVSPLAIMSLPLILARFGENKKVSLYHDASYSFILRTLVLKDIVEKSGSLSLHMQAIALEFKRLGYLMITESDSQSPLCEIENFFGGNSPYPRIKRKGIFQRLFGN